MSNLLIEMEKASKLAESFTNEEGGIRIEVTSRGMFVRGSRGDKETRSGATWGVMDRTPEVLSKQVQYVANLLGLSGK